MFSTDGIGNHLTGTELSKVIDAQTASVRSTPMPRYFFDMTVTDQVRRDYSGVNLPDIAAAKGELIARLARAAAERPQGLETVLTITVRDAEGRALCFGDTAGRLTEAT